MDVSAFVPALLGGVLIGVSAASLLFLTGRIAGVSGIVAGMLRRAPGEWAWRAAFVLGLASGGVLLARLVPTAFDPAMPWNLPRALSLVGAGVLVGFGSRLGSGCTSGHGVCGISRLSPRSIVATCVFMATGMLTVYLLRHVAGGAS